jgi:hypothetical protein
LALDQRESRPEGSQRAGESRYCPIPLWVDGYLAPESSLKKTDLEQRIENFCAAFMECLQAAESRKKAISPFYQSPDYYGEVFPNTWLMLNSRHKKITREQFEKAFLKLEFDGAIEVTKRTNKSRSRIKFIGYQV